MKNVPTEIDWLDYDGDSIHDIDVNYARKIFFGKTNEQVLKEYKNRVLGRFEDLLCMPKKPFQYYIFSFRNYVMGNDFGLCENSDAASSFLNLILIKLQKQPDFIKPLLPDLMPDIEYIANNQTKFEADIEIYRDFKELHAQIKSMS